LYQNIDNLKKRAHLYHNVADDINSVVLHARMRLKEQEHLERQIHFESKQETKHIIQYAKSLFAVAQLTKYAKCSSKKSVISFINELSQVEEELKKIYTLEHK
jgi:hypothetical protein